MILIFYNSLFCTSTQIHRSIRRTKSLEFTHTNRPLIDSPLQKFPYHQTQRVEHSVTECRLVVAGGHRCRATSLPPWKIRIPGLENKDEVISDTVSTKHETRDEGEHEEPNWNDDDEGDQPRRMAEPRWRCTSSQDNDVTHEDHCYRRGLASRTKDISG